MHARHAHWGLSPPKMKILVTPLVIWITFMMDGCVFFGAWALFNAITNLGRPEILFNITPIVIG